MGSPEEIRYEMNRVVGRADELVEQFTRAHAGIDGLTATARSADGQVAVTVGAGGELADLWFGDIGRIRPLDLAAQVLTLARRAQGELPTEVRRILAEHVTAGDPAADTLVAELVGKYRRKFPEQPAEPTRRTRHTGPRQMRIGSIEDFE
jgi:hypothetical protein